MVRQHARPSLVTSLVGLARRHLLGVIGDGPYVHRFDRTQVPATASPANDQDLRFIRRQAVYDSRLEFDNLVPCVPRFVESVQRAISNADI